MIFISQGQFLICGYPHLLDLIVIKAQAEYCFMSGIDILAQVPSPDFPSSESFFLEIILRKKWLINYSENLHKSDIINHLETISRTLDTFST